MLGLYNYIEYFALSRKHASIALLCLSITILAYWPILYNSQFVRDDFDWLQLTRSPLNSRILMTPLWGSVWRPTVAIYFAILQFFFDNNPLSYHIVSIVSFAITGTILYWIIYALIKDEVSALLSSLLFLTRANAAEAVLWSSAIGVVFAGLFGLIAIVLYFRFLNNSRLITYCGALLAGSLTLLSKEEALALPLVICLAIPITRKGSQIRALILTLPFWLLAAGINAIRAVLALDSAFLERVVLNGTAGVILALLRGFVHSIIPFEPGLVSFPNSLIYSWLKGLRTTGVLSAAISVLLLGAFVWAICRKRDRVMPLNETFLLSGILTAVMLPLILLGMAVAWRYSYLPSLAATFLHAVWLRYFRERIQDKVLFLAVCLISVINIAQLYVLQLQLFS